MQQRPSDKEFEKARTYLNENNFLALLFDEEISFCAIKKKHLRKD